MDKDHLLCIIMQTALSMNTQDENRHISNLFFFIFSSSLRATHRLLEADDHDPIEIPAAGRCCHISNPAETDGAIWSEPFVQQGRILEAGSASL